MPTAFDSNTGLGRALYHALDIRFGHTQGRNVLCATPDTDLQRTYPTVFTQSDHIYTHMQVR